MEKIYNKYRKIKNKFDEFEKKMQNKFYAQIISKIILSTEILDKL